jgi:hypothetical protein
MWLLKCIELGQAELRLSMNRPFGELQNFVM